MAQTVLVIDDSIPMHRLIQAHLEADGLTLHSAYDGDTGLVAAGGLLPSLILMDVDMPRIDGFEACKRLKANPATAAIPVIFLTANSLLADRVKGFELGAADYVIKPFKPLELRARVRAALRAKDQMDATTMVDSLTGLWNRAYLDLHIERHVSLAKELRSPLACIVTDFDPSHGSGATTHCDLACVELMRSAGRILLAQSRTEDVVCRWDEWKFAILVTGSNHASARLVADRLCAQISRQLTGRPGEQEKFTCTFGVSDTRCDEKTLVERADAAATAAWPVASNCVNRKGPSGNGLPAVA